MDAERGERRPVDVADMHVGTGLQEGAVDNFEQQFIGRGEELYVNGAYHAQSTAAPALVKGDVFVFLFFVVFFFF